MRVMVIQHCWVVAQTFKCSNSHNDGDNGSADNNHGGDHDNDYYSTLHIVGELLRVKLLLEIPIEPKSTCPQKRR